MDNKPLNVKPVAPSERVSFRCTRCGACCRHLRESVPLNTLDAFRLAKYLRAQGERVDCLDSIFVRFAEPVPLHESGYSVYMLKTSGQDDACIFLQNKHCTIQPAKPAVCALFPIGRGMEVEKDRINEVTTADIRYFFTNPGCGDKSETHTVRDWLGAFGIPLQDEFFIKWQKCVMKLSLRFHEMEKKLGPDMRVAWDSALILLYLTYEVGMEFEPQFEENTAQLQKLLAALEGD